MLVNAVRIACKGPTEKDHKRQYINYHYSGEWLILEASIFDHFTENLITQYKLKVKSTSKEWEITRRYSDFTDLDFHLNQIEAFSTLCNRNSDITLKTSNPLPRKSLNLRNFHFIPATSSFLNERMSALNSWLAEVLSIVTSGKLADVDQKRAQYELNWFLETGANIR